MLRSSNIVVYLRIAVKQQAFSWGGGITLVNFGVEGTTRGTGGTLLQCHIIDIIASSALTTGREIRGAFWTYNATIFKFFINITIKLRQFHFAKHPVIF